MRRSLAIAAVLAGGCVYPAHEPTGLELSWRFVEGNQADGDAGRFVRSCQGDDVETIFLRIFDDDDDARRGAFRFPCAAGFQTNVSFQTEASDAFIRLDSGPYRVELFSELDDGTLEFLSERAFEVGSRGVTVEPWLVTRPTFDWTVVIAGTPSCESLSLRLDYADPAATLAEFEPEEEAADAAALPYRENLASDRGLSFSGLAAGCGEEVEGTHVVEQMDRGAYELVVDVDGRTCTIPVSLDPGSTQTALDLANLPCDA